MLKHKTLTIGLRIITLLTFVSAFHIPHAFCFNQADAKSGIDLAENKLLNCYMAVSEAEKAGADIGDLLEVLNEAGWLLSKAKLAYDNGDFESAYKYALNCSSRLEGFESRAKSLKLEAEQASRMNFLINYVGSAAGSVAVVVSGYAVWIFIKKRDKP